MSAPVQQCVGELPQDEQDPLDTIQFRAASKPEAVGKFWFKGGQLHFEGNAHASAEIFLRELMRMDAAQRAASVPTVTCQIYGHVVGHCGECNVGDEGAAQDVNDTNKVLADNYLKSNAASVPAQAAAERKPVVGEISKFGIIHEDGDGDIVLTGFVVRGISEHTQQMVSGSPQANALVELVIERLRKEVSAVVPAASVQPEFDMPLRKAVQQMTLALNENEWADLLTTDPDAAALEEAIRNVLEQAGQLGDAQPDIGRDAALVKALQDIAEACNCCGDRHDLAQIAQDALDALATQAAPEVASVPDAGKDSSACAKCGDRLPPGKFCKGMACPLNPAQAKGNAK